MDTCECCSWRCSSRKVKDIVYPIGPGQGIIVASDEYRKQYTEDDTRKNASFLEIYSKNQETGENKFYVSVVLKGKGLVRDGDRIFADDIILYRYADILLMKAEAKNALGQILLQKLMRSGNVHIKTSMKSIFM